MIQSMMPHRELSESVKGTYAYPIITVQVAFHVSTPLMQDKEGLSKKQSQLRVGPLSHREIWGLMRQWDTVQGAASYCCLTSSGIENGRARPVGYSAQANKLCWEAGCILLIQLSCFQDLRQWCSTQAQGGFVWYPGQQQPGGTPCGLHVQLGMGPIHSHSGQCF